MLTAKTQFGLYGEHLAEKYLKNKGYLILDKNFRRKCGEIDIIAKKDNKIIFIEVKTRKLENNREMGEGEESVNYYKQQKLLKTAELYLLEKKIDNIFWQFDVLSILIDKTAKIAKIKHIADAF